MKLDLTVGTLQDRSVGWMVIAYKELNNPVLIQKVRRCMSFPV